MPKGLRGLTKDRTTVKSPQPILFYMTTIMGSIGVIRVFAVEMPDFQPMDG